MAKRTVNFTDKSLFNPGNQFLNNINVSSIGQVNSILAAAGVNVGMGSQDDTGKRTAIMEQDAADWQLATVGTIFGGMYQIVQLDSGATAANVGPGRAAFILETGTGGAAGSGASGYVVTDEAHALSTSLIAGIFLNAITPANWGIVQVSGKANLLFQNAALAAAGAIGGVVVLAAAGNGTFNTGAAVGAFPAGAFTTANLGLFVGLQIAAAAQNALSAVHLVRQFLRY